MAYETVHVNYSKTASCIRIHSFMRKSKLKGDK